MIQFLCNTAKKCIINVREGDKQEERRAKEQKVKRNGAKEEMERKEILSEEQGSDGVEGTKEGNKE